MLVLTLEGDRIAGITRFGDTAILPQFGLPRTLRADRRPRRAAKTSVESTRAGARVTRTNIKATAEAPSDGASSGSVTSAPRAVSSG